MQSVTSVSAFDALLKGNKYVFVDFYADWCGPCKMIAPLVEKLSVANPHIVFVKVNVEEAQELTSRYGVSGMPTFIAFTDGVKTSEIVGANKNGIENIINAMK